jgi:hypothetical protein
VKRRSCPKEEGEDGEGETTERIRSNSPTKVWYREVMDAWKRSSSIAAKDVENKEAHTSSPSFAPTTAT